MKNLLLLVFLISGLLGISQQNVKAKKLQVTESAVVGGTSKDASSVLDIQSTTKGVLIPRVTVTERDAISSPANGLLIYNSDSSWFEQYNSSLWVRLGEANTNIDSTGIADLGYVAGAHTVDKNLGIDNLTLDSTRFLDVNNYSLTVFNDSLSLVIDSLANISGGYDSLKLFSLEKVDTTSSKLELYNDTLPKVRLHSDTTSFIVKGLAIGDTVIDNSALLELISTEKGFLIPRMTSVERDAITTPATSLMIYNNTDSEFQYYNGAAWTSLGGGDNMANADLTLDANRTHNLDGNILKFDTDQTGYIEVGNVSVTEGITLYQKSNGINYINTGYGPLNIGAGGNDNLILNTSLLSKFTTNLQVGGTGYIGGTGARLKVRGANMSAGTYTVLFENSGGQEAFRIENDRQTYTKRLNVKGLGSTSATTALLVENSSGTELFKILDDGTISGNFPNFANTDLTLTANRDHNLDGNKLTLKTSSPATGYFGIRNSETASGVECLKIWSEISPRYTYINNIQNSLFLGGNADIDQLELANGFAKYKTRVSIIPDGPVGDAYLQVRGGTGAGATTKVFLVEDNLGGEAFRITNDKQTYTKRLNITGTGGTSATTALLVENSVGTDLFKIDNGGGFALGNSAVYGDKTNVSIGDGATATNTASIAIGDGGPSFREIP